MPPTIPQPSISDFGHTSWSEPVIQFFASFGDNMRALSENYAFMSLLYFLWALFVVMLGVVAYLVYLFIKLQNDEKKQYYENADAQKKPESVVRKHSKTWQEVVTHLKSENDNDWKIAILEADSILSELLEDLGYIGDNLGERLKTVPTGDILSLDSAWAAHKMRNRIAHEGMSLKLSRKEVGDTLAQFEQVFREFNYI